MRREIEIEAARPEVAVLAHVVGRADEIAEAPPPSRAMPASYQKGLRWAVATTDAPAQLVAESRQAELAESRAREALENQLRDNPPARVRALHAYVRTTSPRRRRSPTRCPLFF